MHHMRIIHVRDRRRSFVHMEHLVDQHTARHSRARVASAMAAAGPGSSWEAAAPYSLGGAGPCSHPELQTMEVLQGKCSKVWKQTAGSRLAGLSTAVNTRVSNLPDVAGIRICSAGANTDHTALQLVQRCNQ
jgi:hypothetical protein